MAKIDIAVTEVSPKMAEEWLCDKALNRNFSDLRARQYATDMASGNWELNGVPIIFDTTGKLVDGQHRLDAIVRSKSRQKMVIVRGVNNHAMTTIDTGMSRRLKDFLQIRGEKNATVLAAIISHVQRWDRYQTFLISNYAHQLPSIQQSLDFFDRYADDFRVAAAFGVARKKRSLLTDSVIGALKIIFDSIDEEDSLDFFERLSAGTDMSEGHPIMALRRRLLDNKMSRDKLTSATKAALTIKAWNAYREGREVPRLGWRAGGKAPEDYPIPA